MVVVLGTGLLAAGFVLLHIGLGMLLYLAFQNWWAVGVVFLILGILYTLVPLFIIRRLCAEKTWMQFFKADKLVAQVTKET
jgi:membrane protein YdbS with pleckstrin-like domain